MDNPVEDLVIVEVESETEESDQTTNKSGVDSSTCMSDDKGNNSGDEACTGVNSIQIHNGSIEPDRQPTNDREFDIEECVDVNSAFLDTQGKYLQERWAESIYTNTDISQELVSNLSLCQEMLDTYIFQKMLFEEHIHRIRSTKVYDKVELKMKIERTELSHEMKNFLQTLASQGINLQRKVNLLRDYVEILPRKECTLKECDGNNVQIKVTMDMLTLSDRPSLWIHDEIKPPEDPDDPNDFPFLKVSSVSTRSKERAKLKINDNNDCCRIDDRPYREGCISIHILLSLRTSVPTQSVFKQYLLRIMDSDIKTYLLVYHIGPLVEEWKVVLYQYRGNRESQLPREVLLSDVCTVREDINNKPTSDISEANYPIERDSEEEEEGTALCCIVTEALTGNTINDLEQIPVNDVEDDDTEEDDEAKYQEKLENFSQMKNTEKELKQSDTVGHKQLLLKDVITFWEEHEGRLTYQVTELKECLKYNILPVPNVHRKEKRKTKKQPKRSSE